MKAGEPAGVSGKRESRAGIANYIHSDIMHPKLENARKALRWLGDSRRRLCEFPEAARRRAGFELWEVQQGKEPSDWKAMPSVGAGVNEVRVHTKGEYRVMYVAKFNEAVYVLHAFEKKTQRTVQHDIDLARARYRALIEERRRERL